MNGAYAITMDKKNDLIWFTEHRADKIARYNPKTLEIQYRGKSIADVLGLTVDAAFDFFADEPAVARPVVTPSAGGARSGRARSVR